MKSLLLLLILVHIHVFFPIRLTAILNVLNDHGNDLEKNVNMFFQYKCTINFMKMQ